MTAPARPRNLELEREVLASCLQSNSFLPEVSLIVAGGDHFDLETHRKIFAAMLELHAAGKVADEISLANVFSRDQEIRLDLSRLGAGVPALSRCVQYANDIRELAVRRKMIDLGSSIGTAAKEAHESAFAVATRFADELLSLTRSRDNASTWRIDQIIAEVIAECERNVENGGIFPGYRTGFAGLDRLTLGIPKAAFTLIGAYTRAGKTTFAMNLMRNMLRLHPEIRILAYTLEMTSRAIGRRILAMESRVPLGKIRTGRYDADDARSIVDASMTLGNLGDRLMVNDAPVSIREIQNECRALASRQNLDVVVVDYVQLVETVAEHNREREVSKIGKALMALAKELGAAVIATGQLNEGAAMRDRPFLTDMRESRGLNHDANLGLLLHRPWLNKRDDPEIRKCDTMLFVEKNRDGEMGEVKLHFDGAHMQFREGECDPGCQYYADPVVREREERWTH